MLGYQGHRLLEAADGAEALEVAHAQHLDLIISDILMPTMDGYEFVRQLRADPMLVHTPVIFSTAHYLDHEARALALQCGVPFLLPKPSEPEVVLRLVDAALGLTPLSGSRPQDEEFEREHLRLLTNQLAQKADELRAVNGKLAAMLELGQHLISERDPVHLLEVYCRGARDIIGAKWATVPQLFVNGLDRQTIKWIGAVPAHQGVLGSLLKEHCPCRLQNVSGAPHRLGLPPQFPSVDAFLGVPILYQARAYGWLCLVDKLGRDAFSEVDERLAITLAAQIAVAHENTRLFSNVQRQAAELTQEVAERQRAQEVVQEQVRLAALSADVGLTVTQSISLPEVLRQCIEWFVRHLDVAFARIWTLNKQADVLELQASAGLYTHLDGPHSRVPVGQFKIGLIAQERQPHLTNAVIGDPRVSDQEWAQREGMIAFAGYPLLVGERLVGVIAMFARQPLTAVTLGAIAAVANTIALSIERSHARDALRESELRFRQLAEHIHEVFYLYDSDSERMLYISPAYEQIWGRSAQALYEQRNNFMEAIHPDDQPGVHAMLDQNKQGKPSRVEYRIVRSNGEVRWILDRGFPFRDGLAHGYRVAGVAEDITERKQAEADQAQLQAQLFQAQKIEAVGTLAGGIAHDFNNILGTVFGYSELALMTVPPESAVRPYLQEILTAGKRARDLVRQILTFSRKYEQARQPIQLQAIVTETLRFLRASLPTTIEIRHHYDPSSSIVLADPTQMQQVLMNLCTNAAHAMRDTGGVVEVRLEVVEVTADWAAAHPPLPPGPCMRLSVRDTGHGMAPGTLEHIFEPFFTTKAVGEGTGLGLSVVHGIVASHGGAIVVTSVPGQGTMFALYLPRIDRVATEESPEATVLGGHERILFVDDESALARWGQYVLEALGYNVVTCTSSTEALTIFQAAPQAFDLLITDQTMPGMTGEALARAVWRIRPGLPIILCSGSSATMIPEKVEEMGIRAYLMKPLFKRDLDLAIRQVLDPQNA